MPKYTVTYYTRNSDGTIGANFTGGLTVPQGAVDPQTQVPDIARAVRWIDALNRVTGYVFNFINGAANITQIAALEAPDNPVPSVRVSLITAPLAGGVEVGARSAIVSLWNHQSQSGFVKNPDPLTAKDRTLNRGVVTLTATGASQNTIPVVVPHDLGKVPTAVIANINDAHMPFTYNYTATTFEVQSYAPYVIPAGGYTCNWIAMS